MALFKKKVSVDTMGMIVCETARERAESFYNHCVNNGLLFKPAALQVYAFTYNFYFISRVLSRKYKDDVVQLIMDSAFAVFFRMSKEIFNENDINAIKKDISKKLIEIDINMNLKSTDKSYNPITVLSKQFLCDITETNNYDLDADIIIDIAIELSSWIRFSDFLITEYRIQ